LRGEEGWVEDATLLRWWLDPGDRDLIEVSREEARSVASAAGIELDQPAATAPIEPGVPEASAAPQERQDSARASETAEALRRSPYARLVEHPPVARVLFLSGASLRAMNKALTRSSRRVIAKQGVEAHT
jgi:hypothetical protein